MLSTMRVTYDSVVIYNVCIILCSPFTTEVGVSQNPAYSIKKGIWGHLGRTVTHILHTWTPYAAMWTAICTTKPARSAPSLQGTQFVG